MFNAEERAAAPAWQLPCFPRLYFYDVLRGLSALVHWSERSGAVIPDEAIDGVMTHLTQAFPDGIVRVQRRSFENMSTLTRGADGTWHREPASRFPLLEATSIVGAPSAALTSQWNRTYQALRR